MITTKEATQIVLNNCPDPGSEEVTLSEAGGRILAQDITADTDLPPFDRVMMDGIAVKYSDLESGVLEFTIVGIQRAGAPPLLLAGECNCIEVMTGAVCPEGATAIIPYEQIKLNGNKALVEATEFKRGMNIHSRARDYKSGDVLVTKGQIIGVPEIGIAASCGLTNIRVIRQPRTIVVSTGDELVEIDQKPEPHQIRKSGVYVLKELLSRYNIKADLAHAPDDEAQLNKLFNEMLKNYELVVITGGVSKGKYDLVPDALSTHGVNCLFHRIAQKPGKPMWFGRKEQVTVFALPGNPVSSLMCATRYLVPWIKKISGKNYQTQTTLLGDEYELRGSLTQFAVVKITTDAGGQRVAHIIKNNGSGDYASLSGADGFVELSADKKTYSKNDQVDLYLF